jgi:hypothetical protein
MITTRAMLHKTLPGICGSWMERDLTLPLSSCDPTRQWSLILILMVNCQGNMNERRLTGLS